MIPEIFVSHSKDDTNIDYIANTCIDANTKPILEELENIIVSNQIITGQVTHWKIKADIERSKAVFVILSPLIVDEFHKHTRDWIAWETGVAAAYSKDVWVLEPYSELGKISVVIPYLSQYMVFDPNNEKCTKYLKDVFESYSNSKNIRPTGDIINGRESICSGCMSVYGVHLPVGLDTFRCPICGKSRDRYGVHF